MWAIIAVGERNIGGAGSQPKDRGVVPNFKIKIWIQRPVVVVVVKAVVVVVVVCGGGIVGGGGGVVVWRGSSRSSNGSHQ